MTDRHAYIDLKRYPIHRPESREYAALLQAVHTALADDGCAVLKSFLTTAGIAAVCQEAEKESANAFRSQEKTNAYFGIDDPSLPIKHPVRQFYKRSNAFIPADNFGADGPLRGIHDFNGFDSFVQRSMQAEHFYRYADPLADLIVNQATAGNGFPWHFDTNNFTVTLAIQNAEQGGEFEYAPNIRRDGENFEAVQAVLEERCEQVKTLVLEPGDLQLFKGRYSLHRVAPLKGSRKRYVAIFSYVEHPDMVGSLERTRQLYGRVLPIHTEHAGSRIDSLID